MISIGDVVERVEIMKTDNMHDEGYDGYKVTLTLSCIDKEKRSIWFDSNIRELDDSPRGIYEYVTSECVTQLLE